MNNSNIIRSITSALLIIVFALSITPVAILHNLSANHKDISFTDKNQPGDQYAKAGINCKVTDFVAEAQFFKAIALFNISAQKRFIGINSLYASAFYSRSLLYATLRGPPVTAA